MSFLENISRQKIKHGSTHRNLEGAEEVVAQGPLIRGQQRPAQGNGHKDAGPRQRVAEGYFINPGRQKRAKNQRIS